VEAIARKFTEAWGDEFASAKRPGDRRKLPKRFREPAHVLSPGWHMQLHSRGSRCAPCLLHQHTNPPAAVRERLLVPRSAKQLGLKPADLPEDGQASDFRGSNGWVSSGAPVAVSASAHAPRPKAGRQTHATREKDARCLNDASLTTRRWRVSSPSCSTKSGQRWQQVCSGGHADGGCW